MLSGIINVNKPKGSTSHQAVSKLRKILQIRQIGHTGTLDPLATGVLPICIGKAARIIEYLDTSKAYRASVLLGVSTDTYDVDGEIIDKKPVKLDIEKIKAFLQEFKGEITQTPPIYSAVHYKGKRLYEYARKNIEVADIPERKVVINNIKLVDIENPDSENPVLIVDIDCSGGTYIRSIAHDLGEKLGYGGCIQNLIRTRSGKFRIEDSLTLEQTEEFYKNNEIEKFLLPAGAFLDFEVLEINEEQKNRIKNGQGIYVEEKKQPKGKLVQLVYENKLAAIAKVEEKNILPAKVFC